MTYRNWQLITVLLPPLLVGGFEFTRHHCLLLEYSLGMDMGNLFITLLVLILSFLYARWMFRTIQRQNERIAEEQARRAVYEERERLARELHDGMAQTLFFLNVKLKQGRVEEARTAVAAIDNSVRQAIFNLRALPEEGGTLQKRLQKWLAQWSALTGIDVQEEICEWPDHFFTSAEEVQLFGIIQEAFTNIRKHSGATSACLRLVPLPASGWQLAVTDDGEGIACTAIDPKTYGLSMMAQRAAELHAEFDIQKRAEGGTALTLTRHGGGKKR